MQQTNHINDNRRANVSFLSLLLAFFTPFEIDNRKAVIKPAMISAYAALYAIRNGIAALVTCAVGAVLIKAGFTISGTIVIGLFVVFAGLFSAFLAATVGAYRNTG